VNLSKDILILRCKGNVFYPPVQEELMGKMNGGTA